MAAKDLTAIGLEILQTARNELYLNLPYLDVALCSLDFQPGGGVTLSLATDGETLYYDGSFLSERYLRSRTAVDRAYLHVLLHCMLRHLWKKRGRAPELWDLACDVAVESILDELDYPCLAGGFVPAKQKFYGECRAEMPVLTAEGIYRHLLRLDLPEYEVARLQRTFLVDDHGLWDPDQQDQEQQKQREQKWQGVSEKTQTGLETVLAGKATGGEAVLEQIQVAKSLTSRPFGVNIMLMSPFVEEVAQVVAEEKVAVVTTGAGNPTKYMALWKEAGIRVIPVVASVAMAKLMTRLGASALIAEGGVCGGHVGELTTMVLVPQICDATTLPVIAAGGIADGRGVAAAFMLGACGVQMGTRFLSAEECSIHPVYKERILKANDLCTMVTGKRLGHPVRSLRTNFARNYAKAEYGGMDDEALEALGSGALRKAVVEGDLEEGCFLSGQVAAMVNKIQPAAEIVREVIEGAEPVLKGATQWVK